MKLEQFIAEFDKVGSIALLEGKRKVSKADEEKLIGLGKLLVSETKYLKFRSGNAAGSDELFSKGVASVDPFRLEVITPYSSHRSKSNLAGNTVSLDDINLLQEPELVYHSKKNKKTERLIDKYVDGARDRYSIKAAYIIRDTVKVLGSKDNNPATIGIFYDDLDNPKSGGTGHTMNVCEELNIPVLDQSNWLKWL